MLQLQFLDGTTIEMREGQEKAVVSLLKERNIDPETIIIVQDENEVEIETLKLCDLFNEFKDK